MLLANYTQSNRNTAREIGNAFTNPLAQFRAVHFMAFYTPDDPQPLRDMSAFNHGYNTHYAWAHAMKSGAIASTLNLDGYGSVSASALAVRLAAADLTGSGDLSATASLIVQAVAGLVGSGTISDADVQAFLVIVANLTGAGGVNAADLDAYARIAAALAGTGATHLTPTAIAEISADIVVTGTGLTTANVGEAVMAALGDGQYTYGDMLRIIASVTAGLATGGPGSPVFRDLPNTKDRVAGTADSSGNRTAVTYDPS